MVQFCSRFVARLNAILAPIFSPLKADTLFKWTTKCQHSFDMVNQILISAPILRSPGVDDKLVLDTDVSDHGICACLRGVMADNTEFCIAYSSHKFRDNEPKWSIVEKEGFALINTIH